VIGQSHDLIYGAVEGERRVFAEGVPELAHGVLEGGRGDLDALHLSRLQREDGFLLGEGLVDGLVDL
jgi:hypothetical protein